MRELRRRESPSEQRGTPVPTPGCQRSRKEKTRCLSDHLSSKSARSESPRLFRARIRLCRPEPRHVSCQNSWVDHTELALREVSFASESPDGVHISEVAWGYTAIANVNNVPVKARDSQESFWLAETMKYFYLIFAPRNTLNLEEWVLNTEVGYISGASSTQDPQEGCRKHRTKVVIAHFGRVGHACLRPAGVAAGPADSLGMLW